MTSTPSSLTPFAFVGSSGSAQSTLDGKKVASKHFDNFIKSLLGNGKSFADLSEDEVCDEDLFRQFAGFLVAFTNDDGESLASNTCLQYLSGAKNIAQEKFPQNAIWTRAELNNNSWYTKIRVELERIKVRDAFQKGEAIVEKADPIARVTMLEILKYYFAEGRRESMEKRCAFILSFLCVGRTGEVAATCWESMHFDRDVGCLVLDWRERKTANHCQMPLFCDAENFEFDIFHALACLLVLCYGSNTNSPFIFPSLGGKNDRASRTIGRWLAAVSLQNPEFGDLRGTGIRSGAANFLASIDGIELHHIILRGGWSFKSICTVFEYLLSLLTTLSVGGRALSGWKSIKKGAFPPRIDVLFLNNEDRELLASLSNSLFFFANEILAREDLQFLKEIMLASLIMHLPAVITTYGDNHLIVKAIIQASNALKISYEKLVEWSNFIKKDWLARNFESSVESLSRDKLVNLLISKVHEQSIEIQLLKHNIDTLTCMIHKQDERFEQLFNCLKGQNLATLQYSPQKRRKFDDDSESVEDDQQNAEKAIDNLIVAAPVESSLSKTSIGAGYKLESLKGISLADMFKDYFIHDLSKNANFDAESSIRSKVNLCIKAMLSIISDDESSLLLAVFPAKKNDEAAIQILLEIAKKAQNAVMADLAEKEGIDPGNARHKPTVEAVSRRICQLSKDSKVSANSKVPSNAEIAQFFAKKK
jgi:hypothetical protein